MCFINIHQINFFINFRPCAKIAFITSSWYNRLLTNHPITWKWQATRRTDWEDSWNIKNAWPNVPATKWTGGSSEQIKKSWGHKEFLWCCYSWIGEYIAFCCFTYGLVQLYFLLNFGFPLFLCMLMYGNVHKNKGKLKFNWKKNCKPGAFTSW